MGNLVVSAQRTMFDTPSHIQLDQITLFGDSITQQSFNPATFGFGAVLSNAYVRKMDVVNRGYSGMH